VFIGGVDNVARVLGATNFFDGINGFGPKLNGNDFGCFVSPFHPVNSVKKLVAPKTRATLSTPTMNTPDILSSTVKAMLDGDRGLLAMDESIPTCHKRFAALGIPQTEEARRAWRELIVTTPGLGESISGAILFDETIRQKTKDGRLFVDLLQKAGIVPGIKVDEGAHALADFPARKVTDGLDGLRQRLADYFQQGARFAKWRAVITIGDGIPTRTCHEVNAHALARYARSARRRGSFPSSSRKC